MVKPPIFIYEKFVLTKDYLDFPLDGVNKLYDFFKAFTAVFSTVSGTEVQRRANEKWAQLKAQVEVGDMGPYNEKMTKLKHKKDTIKANSSITSFFV